MPRARDVRLDWVEGQLPLHLGVVHARRAEELMGVQHAMLSAPVAIVERLQLQSPIVITVTMPLL